MILSRFLYDLVNITLPSVLDTVLTVLVPLQSQFRWEPLQILL